MARLRAYNGERSMPLVMQLKDNDSDIYPISLIITDRNCEITKENMTIFILKLSLPAMKLNNSLVIVMKVQNREG